MDNPNTGTPGLKMIEKKSGIPILAFGGVWLLYSLAFSLYKVQHFVIAGIISLVVYFFLNKVIPAKVEYVKAPAFNAQTGDSDADAFLKEASDLLAKISASAQNIKKPQTKGTLKNIEGDISRILAFVSENPKSVKDLRRFINYYLPTLVKLCQTYETFEAQEVQGENITSSLERIEKIFTSMDISFDKMLDSLFADRALDISTDITVLEGMLEGEGLAPTDQNTLQF